MNQTINCIIYTLAEHVVKCEMKNQRYEKLLFIADVIFITVMIKLVIDLVKKMLNDHYCPIHGRPGQQQGQHLD